MRRETIAQRMHKIADGTFRVRCGLDGCPEGGWPETEQAMRRLTEDLPYHTERSYTTGQLVDALYHIDSARRYRINPACLPAECTETEPDQERRMLTLAEEAEEVAAAAKWRADQAVIRAEEADEKEEEEAAEDELTELGL